MADKPIKQAPKALTKMGEEINRLAAKQKALKAGSAISLVESRENILIGIDPNVIARLDAIEARLNAASISATCNSDGTITVTLTL